MKNGQYDNEFPTSPDCKQVGQSCSAVVRTCICQHFEVLLAQVRTEVGDVDWSRKRRFGDEDVLFKTLEEDGGDKTFLVLVRPSGPCFNGSTNFWAERRRKGSTH